MKSDATKLTTAWCYAIPAKLGAARHNRMYRQAIAAYQKRFGVLPASDAEEVPAGTMIILRFSLPENGTKTGVML